MSEMKPTLEYIIKRYTEAVTEILIVLGLFDSYIKGQEKVSE